MSLENAGGLFEAVRLSFRPPSGKRYAVVVGHLSCDALAASHLSFLLPGEGRQAVGGAIRDMMPWPPPDV